MSEWIKIEDEVPDLNQIVWYFFDVVGVHKGNYYGLGEIGHEFGNDYGYLSDDVTHWMPYETGQSQPEKPKCDPITDELYISIEVDQDGDEYEMWH